MNYRKLSLSPLHNMSHFNFLQWSCIMFLVKKKYRLKKDKIFKENKYIHYLVITMVKFKQRRFKPHWHSLLVNRRSSSVPGGCNTCIPSSWECCSQLLTILFAYFILSHVTSLRISSLIILKLSHITSSPTTACILLCFSL